MPVRMAAFWALVSQYSSFAFSFITSVLLARWYIVPDELGLFSIAFAAITLIAFLQDFGVSRFITGERDLDEAKIQMAYTISVGFAWGIALITFLLAGPIAQFYGDPRLLPVAQIIALSYFMVPLAIVPQALCQRKMDFKSNTMIEISSAVANGTVALLLAARGYGALALAWGAFAQQAARMIVSQWRAGGMLPWPLRTRGAEPVLRLGATNSVLIICNSIASRMPELVIGRLIDNAAVGLFTRAVGLALQLRLLLTGAVSGVFFPAFRQVRDSGEPLGPPYLRVIGAYTGITWPTMAGIAVLAEPLVRLLYGENWVAAAPLLTWIAVSQMFYVSLPLNGDLPLLFDRKRELVNLTILDTLFSVLLLALSAPHGLLWVAISRAVHGVLWLAIYVGLMQRITGFAWAELRKLYLRSFAVTVAALAPTLLLYAFWHGPHQAGFVQMMLSAALGGLCWLAALRLVGHPAYGEMFAMWETARRIPKGENAA